jgi:molecular chaperone GrpE (heat shock protein)
MEYYHYRKDGKGFQYLQENDRIGDTYFKLETMQDPTDPITKYAMKLQSNAEQQNYTNEYKRQQHNKKKFVFESISKSMSSSIPLYTLDQVFFFNQLTKKDN